jgi:hypothetical protein
MNYNLLTVSIAKKALWLTQKASVNHMIVSKVWNSTLTSTLALTATRTVYQMSAELHFNVLITVTLVTSLTQWMAHLKWYANNARKDSRWMFSIKHAWKFNVDQGLWVNQVVAFLVLQAASLAQIHLLAICAMTITRWVRLKWILLALETAWRECTKEKKNAWVVM